MAEQVARHDRGEEVDGELDRTGFELEYALGASVRERTLDGLSASVANVLLGRVAEELVSDVVDPDQTRPRELVPERTARVLDRPEARPLAGEVAAVADAFGSGRQPRREVYARARVRWRRADWRMDIHGFRTASGIAGGRRGVKDEVSLPPYALVCLVAICSTQVSTVRGVKRQGTKARKRRTLSHTPRLGIQAAPVRDWSRRPL